MLLLAQAIAAWRAGRVSVAGICLGGLGYTLFTLWAGYRASRAATPAPEATPVTRAGVIVALVYPEQQGRLVDLLAAVDPACRDVLILVIQTMSRAAWARTATALVGAEAILRERESPLFGELAREVERSGRQLTVVRAAGPDPALVTLEMARTLGASRVVALRAEDMDASEQQQRALAVWERLPPAREAMRVDLVGGSAEETATFELPATPAIVVRV